MGIPAAWAALRAAPWLEDRTQCLWYVSAGDAVADVVSCPVPMAVPLAVPWLWLAGLLAAVPLVSGLAFQALTHTRAVPPRR